MTTLEEKTQQFGDIALPLRGTPEYQRISLYVQDKTGSRLQVYLQGTAAESDKIKLLEDLTEIIKAKDWDKLPLPPSGQTQAEGAPVVQTEIPAAVQTATPAVATPAPAADVDKEPAGEAAPADDDEIIEDSTDKILSALGKQLKAAKGGLSEKQVRTIVREEVKLALPAAVRAALKELIAALK